MMTASISNHQSVVKCKRLSPEERRVQLPETAMDVFAKMGIERAGHGDIAKRADVSTPTVFNYFPTRALLVESKPGAAKTFSKWGVSFDSDIRPTYLTFQMRMADFLVAYLPDNPEDPAKARAEARILYGLAKLLAAMAFDNFKPEDMYNYVGRIADILSQPV